jgi:hypothetical protein
MERVIAEVKERYGSFREYLLAKGADDATLSRLRDALLD